MLADCDFVHVCVGDGSLARDMSWCSECFVTLLWRPEAVLLVAIIAGVCGRGRVMSEAVTSPHAELGLLAV